MAILSANKKDMLMLRTILIVASLSSTILYAATGLDYLNGLREKAGLIAFSQEANLTSAAQNHSDYMQRNNVSGHDEEEGVSGYTGVNHVDRVLYAGYFSKNVGENVSYGTPTVESSIDGLFSAIYHRFGFLSLLYDEIGIGISEDGKYYTYNMGNAALNDLCKNGTYSDGSYLKNVCSDKEKKIASSDYTAAIDNIKSKAPSLILWPPVNSNDIPPVFNEESPDPLPNYSVSGYPISIQFNYANFNASLLDVSSFTLEDSNGTQLTDITLMTEANDPHKHFSAHEFALFPEERLEWGSKYMAELVSTYDGKQTTKKWCFATRSLETDRFYRVENDNNISLNVVTGKSYAIYVVPNDGKDILGRADFSYNTSEPDSSLIDSNTIQVTLTGDIGQYANLSFANGQKVNFTIANTDTASTPKAEECDSNSSDESSGDNSSGDENTDNGSTQDSSSNDTSGDSNSDGASGGGGCTYNPNSNSIDFIFILMMLGTLFYPLRHRYLN